MTKGHKRLNLYACNVQILTRSLPIVKNVFSCEVTSWFILNQQRGQSVQLVP